jgi:uncharacterized protein
MFDDFNNNSNEKSLFNQSKHVKKAAKNDQKLKNFGPGNCQLTKKDLSYIVYGACFLGSGGGGSVGLALRFIDSMINDADVIRYVNPDNLEPNKNVSLVAVLGSPEKMLDGFGRTASLNAFHEMDNYLTQFSQQPLGYLMPVEMGAINVLIPFIISAKKGIEVINGDPSGRAVPEMSMNLFNTNKLSLNPVILTSDTDDSGYYQKITIQVKDANDAENQARQFARLNNNIAGIACYPMPTADLNCSTLSNNNQAKFVQWTVGLAWHLGRNIVESKNYNKFLKHLDSFSLPSYKLFEGTIIHKDERAISGFDVGKITVTNENETFFIYYKNETLLVWNETRKRYVAMGPDSINFLTRKAAQPFTHADINSASEKSYQNIPLGTEIGIIGLGAYSKMQDPVIVELFLSNIQETLAAFPEDHVPVPDNYMSLRV